MVYPLLRHRYSALSRISARIANSIFCFGQLKKVSTLNSSRISPPWLLLPPAIEGGGGGDIAYRFYNLAEARVESLSKSKSESESELPAGDECEFVGSSHGWLALFNPRNNRLFLSNPITGRLIKLPPIETLPDPDINFRGIVSKIILTCSPDDQEDDEECRAFMIFGPADRLAFCHPLRRSSTASWTPLGNLYYKGENGQIPRRYTDLVFSSRRKLLFCVVKTTLVLECWDLRDPLPRICWSQPIPRVEEEAGGLEVRSICPIGYGYPDVRFHLFLVFQSDQLFLVRRRSMRIRPDGSYPVPIYFSKYRGWGNHDYPYQTMAFDVHRVVGWDHIIANDDDEGEEKLKCVYKKGSLDGLAMFLGMNHTFAISGDECTEMKLEPDCIYFADTNKHPRPAGSLYGGHDIGIFQYRNRTFSPCVYPREVEKIKRIVPAPMWFTPSPS